LLGITAWHLPGGVELRGAEIGLVPLLVLGEIGLVPLLVLGEIGLVRGGGVRR
jgi:hypothetical protein